MLEPLEQRICFSAGDYVPWRYAAASLDAAAGAAFTPVQTVTTDTRRTYVIGLIDRQIAVAALGSNGRIDTTFAGGVVRSPTGKMYESSRSTPFESAAADASGNLFVATATDVVKFRFSGKRDLGFGYRGVVTTGVSNAARQVNDVLPTGDGGALVAYRVRSFTTEEYSLYNAAAARPKAERVFLADRLIGETEEPASPPGQINALLRPAGDGYAMVYRSQMLDFDTIGNDVVRTSNALDEVRFDARLRVVDQKNVAIGLNNDLQDVRVIGSSVFAATNGETVQFGKGSIRRKEIASISPAAATHTALAADGTRWTVVDPDPDHTGPLNLLHTDAAGAALSGSRKIVLADDGDNVPLSISVTGSGDVFVSTGSATPGGLNIRRVTPADGVQAQSAGRLDYHHVYYVYVHYFAPDGISEATLDQPGQAANDLTIIGPNGIHLQSGLSGQTRDGRGGFVGRYWIKGPGGSWDPTDDSVYSVRLTPGDVADGVGVYDLSEKVLSFTVDYKHDISA